METALVLDDRDVSIDAAHAEAWRTWLRTSNVLSLRDWPKVITTVSLVRSEQKTGTGLPASAGEVEAAAAEAAAEGTQVDVSWPRPWQEAFEDAAEGLERELLGALAGRDGLEAPVIGQDGPEGVVLDISWPERHVAVDMPTLTEEDRALLASAGWRLVEPDPDRVLAALATARTMES